MSWWYLPEIASKQTGIRQGQPDNGGREICRSTVATFQLTQSRSTSARKSPRRSRTSTAVQQARPEASFTSRSSTALKPTIRRFQYYIDGGNRAGRPVEVREKLLADLKGAFVDITGVSVGELGGRITEGPASWSMEGGHVLPEPGDEGPEWCQHAAAD